MITETLKRTVKKTRVSERGKIFEHVYRQLIPSRKGRQSNGQFRNLVDGFNPEARTLISYVSLGLKEHGLDNHADRLMQHYGFSEEVALDVLSPTMKNKSEYYTMIMSSVGKLQEEVHAIFSDGQDRDYTVKDLLEASARNNAGVSGPCVYVYQGEPLDKVIPRIEALMLGSKGKTIPDKMRADYERLNHILNEDGHSGMSTTDALHFLLVQEIGRFYIHRIDDDGRKSLRKAGNVRDGLEDVYGDNVMQRVHGIHPLLAEVMNNLDNVANELEETVFVSTSGPIGSAFSFLESSAWSSETTGPAAFAGCWHIGAVLAVRSKRAGPNSEGMYCRTRAGAQRQVDLIEMEFESP